MNDTGDWTRLLCASAPHEIAICVLLLAGWLGSVVGCQGESKSRSQKRDVETTKPSAATALARTWKIRQVYVDAKSEKELKAARKALIADLKKRYAGIDCHAPQDKIGPHKLLFSQLMQEWNPIGCTIEDLKAIAGKPESETKDSVTYVFDSGEKAEIWIFKGQPQIVEIGHRWGG